MGGVLNLILSSGKGGVPVIVTNAAMSSTNPGNSNTFAWYGWSSVFNAGGTGFLSYPVSAGGGVSVSPYIVNGLTILGVVSRSAPNGTIDAAAYYVYVAGNNTTGINYLTINGTTLISPTATFDSLSQGNVSNTRFQFTRTDTTTLFGTTVGASVPIIVA